MSVRFKTVFSGFDINAKDLNNNNLATINCCGLYKKFYNFIKKLDTPSQITASYELQFVDTYFKDQPIVHSVKRKIDFYVVPFSVYTDVNKTNISSVKEYVKSKKIPLENIFIIDSCGHCVYPNRRVNLPQKIYKFFDRTCDQR